MTKTLQQLAEEEHAARMRLEAMAMANVAGKTYEERKQMAVSYAEAKRAAWLAKQALKEAIEAPPETKE